jgi:hypothetical protein
MKFFKWNACHYKQDILNQNDLIRPRTGNILVIYNQSGEIFSITHYIAHYIHDHEIISAQSTVRVVMG